MAAKRVLQLLCYLSSAGTLVPMKVQALHLQSPLRLQQHHSASRLFCAIYRGGPCQLHRMNALSFCTFGPTI